MSTSARKRDMGMSKPERLAPGPPAPEGEPRAAPLSPQAIGKSEGPTRQLELDSQLELPHPNLSERLFLVQAPTTHLVTERSREQLLKKAFLLRFAIPEIENYLVFLVSPSTGHPEAVAGGFGSDPLAEISRPEVLPVWEHLLRQGEPAFLAGVSSLRRFEPLRPLFLREDVASLWWVPFPQGEGIPAGALAYSFGKGYQPTQDDQTIGLLFAGHLAMALRQQGLFEQLVAKTEEAEALLEDNRRRLEEISLIHRVAEAAS